jgi:S2P endopeptidase
MLPYIDFIKTSGIKIQFFRISFHTNKFNRIIKRISPKFPSIYKKSFTLGAYVAIFLMPIALLMMLISLLTYSTTNNSNSNISNLSSGSGSYVKSSAEETAHLEILLPGVNLPLNQIGYYVIALFICSVVHEAGKK